MATKRIAEKLVSVPIPVRSVQDPAQVGRALPALLKNFLQKYPPPALFPPTTSLSTTSTIPNAPPTASVASATSSANPNVPATETPTPTTTAEHELPYPNPFLPRKNYVTGKWWGPKYGLMKQAKLVKQAQQFGLVDLLPYTIKKPGEKEKRRIERGLQVKGTGVGQKVKGKMWERTLKGRLEARKQAMLNMPQMIEEWKQKGHGRGWKKWPK
ncbi:hypothetical protein BCR34DRAFT_483212 [Clohesyomyces aquaticus]|uniref:Large ribosomal subunit protein mL59 domain-containing protein n=1 Tax=Clohesyomyces aquaticus TaxID=1231657 RepID=A0A1Y1ZPC5_9PLEO|nr:hypothetical protein BCR34DRAFT_483212 [Clohesyomyces aquaticus]